MKQQKFYIIIKNQNDLIKINLNKKERFIRDYKYINIDEVTENNWIQVGHFFWKPFYVYAYSFADCLVNSLQKVYQKGMVKDFADKYLNMLSLTGVRRYDEILKPFGLNAKDAKFWDFGLSLIPSYIDELEKLDKAISKQVISYKRLFRSLLVIRIATSGLCCRKFDRIKIF